MCLKLLSAWPACDPLLPAVSMSTWAVVGGWGCNHSQGALGTSAQPWGNMKEEARAAAHALELGDPFLGEVR